MKISGRLVELGNIVLYASMIVLIQNFIFESQIPDRYIDLLYCSTSIGVSIVCLYNHRQTFSLWNWDGSFHDLGIAILVAISLFLVFWIQEFLLFSKSSNPDLFFSHFSDAIKNDYRFSLTLLNTVLFAPIAEEVIFRGYGLRMHLNLSRNLKVLWIVTISGLFSLFHLSSASTLEAHIFFFLFSITLSSISISRNSILISVVIHIVYNSLFLLFFIL